MNSLGNEVVEAVLGSSLSNYVINLMTMDYGSSASTPCPTTQTWASPTCNSVSGTTALEYTNRFLSDLGI